jgi:hypothetical protein
MEEDANPLLRYAMAKDHGKARVRVFFGEIEGDNETIRDGLRSIAAAVNKTFNTTPAIVRILTTENDMSEEQIAEHVQEQLAVDSVEEVFEPDQVRLSAPKAKNSVPSGKRKAPTYSLVKDLNLRPEGKKSLREFYAEKKPADQQQQLAVVVYYLHRILELPKVTTNHVYTGLKDVEERVPSFLPQAIRNVANRKGWVDSSNSEGLRTTVAGDNFVEKDLPANPKGAKNTEDGAK